MASEQQLEAGAVLGQLTLLAVAITVGNYLKRKQVLWMGGAGAALLLGVVVGVLIRLADTAPLVGRWMVFQADFFFLVLLPPIMFDACFNLDSRLFIKNLGSVCALAFAGTTISTFAVGVNMWLAGKLKLCYGLTLMQALTFGALISATDPVTVLAVFQTLGAQPDLYMNVFGESVLNDAVAMVLFQTFNSFAVHEVALSTASILKGIGAFFGIFLGSTLLGIILGFALAALLKTRWYHGNTHLETGLMLLYGYGSYMAGTAVGLSGIVCVMFCSMVAGGYAAPNLSPAGLSCCRSVYGVLASFMEVFVFCYIGISLFMEPQEWHSLGFTVVCLFGLAWSRAANILPCCAVINHLRPQNRSISRQHQLLLWWSGLRGAMAFALSVEALKSFPGETGKVMMTCTFMVIFITVLLNGGSTGYLLSWCGLLAKGSGAHGDAVSNLRQEEGEEVKLLETARRGSSSDAHVDCQIAFSAWQDKTRHNGNGMQGEVEQEQQLLLEHGAGQRSQQLEMQGVRTTSDGLPLRASAHVEQHAEGDMADAAGQSTSAAGGNDHRSVQGFGGQIDRDREQLQRPQSDLDGDSLQALLDRWSAQHLQAWFVHSESARQHTAQQLQH